MKNNFLKKALIIFLILFDCFVFRYTSTDNMYFFVSIIIILFNAILIGGFLIKDKSESDKRINVIIFVSFIIRIFIMLLDIFGYNLVFSGMDSESFYRAAIGEIIFPHNYVYFLKNLFFFVGNSRLAAEYLNTILSLFSILSIKKICKLLNVKDNFFPIALFALAPVNILLSGCLLRESIMIFLNCLSLLYFVKWYKTNKLSNFLISCILVFLSAWFHSGMIIGILGYGLFYILYNHKTDSINFHRSTFLAIAIVFSVFIILYKLFGNSVTLYFNKIKSLEDIGAIRDIGNTDYLTFITTPNSILQLLVWSPLKLIYFYFSPMPWDCYSFGTVAVFLFSSTIYIFLFYNILKNKNKKMISKMLLFLVLLTSLVYSWGTTNAGTAMRHREKLLPFLVVIYAVERKEKKYEKGKNNS